MTKAKDAGAIDMFDASVRRLALTKRMRIEEPVGWMKTVGSVRQTDIAGASWFKRWDLQLRPCNLIHIPKLLVATGVGPCPELEKTN